MLSIIVIVHVGMSVKQGRDGVAMLSSTGVHYAAPNECQGETGEGNDYFQAIASFSYDTRMVCNKPTPNASDRSEEIFILG
jgi:hypothetical protein